MNSSSDRKKAGGRHSKASHRDEMKDLNPRKEGPKRNLRHFTDESLAKKTGYGLKLDRGNNVLRFKPRK